MGSSATPCMLVLATGERLDLPASALVGRASAADLHVPDPRASRRHALLTWGEDRWSVRDLDSSCGTFVDGRRIPARETVELLPGAILGFGAPSGHFRTPGGPAPGEATVNPDRRVGLHEVWFHAEVNDGAIVEVQWTLGGWPQRVDVRAHHGLAVVLAEAGEPVHLIDIAEKLGLKPDSVYTHVKRLRKELAGLGVAGAKDVVVFAPGQMLCLGVSGEVNGA